jgi:hypothetical protein
MIVQPYETGIVHANSLDHLLREVENFWMHEPPRTAMWHPGNSRAVTSDDYPVRFSPESVVRKYYPTESLLGRNRINRLEVLRISDFPSGLEFIHYLKELEKKGVLQEVLDHPTPLIASIEGYNTKGSHRFEVDFYDVGALKNIFYSRFGQQPYVPQGYPQLPYAQQGYQPYAPQANQGVVAQLLGALGQAIPGFGTKPEFEYALLQNYLMKEDLTYQEYHLQTHRSIKTFFSMMDSLPSVQL